MFATWVGRWTRWVGRRELLVTLDCTEYGPLVAAMLRRVIPLEGGAAAIAFGHIVAAQTRELLAVTRAHKRVHVLQCERWGPFFMPAYLLAGAWSWLHGRGAYRGNYFERQAIGSRFR
jgi:hypothetical protein